MPAGSFDLVSVVDIQRFKEMSEICYCVDSLGLWRSTPYMVNKENL